MAWALAQVVAGSVCPASPSPATGGGQTGHKHLFAMLPFVEELPVERAERTRILPGSIRVRVRRCQCGSEVIQPYLGVSLELILLDATPTEPRDGLMEIHIGWALGRRKGLTASWVSAGRLSSVRWDLFAPHRLDPNGIECPLLESWWSGAISFPTRPPGVDPLTEARWSTPAPESLPKPRR